MTPSTPRSPSTPAPRWRRIARFLGRGLGWFALGLVLLVALALVAINVTPLGRLVSEQVTAALEPTFRGQIVLRRIGQIDLDGLTGAEVELRDPEGRPVLVAQGIDVRLFWPAVVVRALSGSEPLKVPLRRVAIQQLDVHVIDDGAGTPTLAHAFEPKAPPAPDEAAAPTSVGVASLSVASTTIQGSLTSFGPIDAQLNDLQAGLLSDAAGLELVLTHLELAARQLPQVDRVTGQLSGEVFLPAEPAPGTPAPPAADGITTQIHALRPTPALRRVRLEFNGDVADSAAEAQLRWLGEEISGGLRAASLSPATLTQILPALSPSAPVALQARFEGPLENLGFEAQLEQARARVSAKGRLRGESPQTRVSVRVEASNVDLSQLLAELPSTQIALVAEANLESEASGSQGDYRVVSTRSSVAGERVPETTLQGELQLPQAGPLKAWGKLEIAEPGASTKLVYGVTSGPQGSTAQITSATKLEHAPRLRDRLGLDARGSVHLHAELDSAKQHLKVELSSSLRNLRHPSVTASAVTASLSAQGSFAAPELRLRADARRVRAAGRSLSRAWLWAQGTPERAQVTARLLGKSPERIDLQATVAARSVPQLLNPRIRVHDGAEELLIAARDIGFSAGRLAVNQLSLDGPGHAELSLVYGRSLEQLELNTRALDVARLLRVFAVQTPLRSGWVDLQAQLSTRGRTPRGRVVGDLRQISFAELAGSLHLDLGVERGRVNGDAALELTPGGTTKISVKELRIPLGPLRAKELERMQGELSLQGELDLARLQSLLPLIGLERAQGQVRYAVRLQGSEGSAAGLSAHLESRELVLVGQRPDVDQSTDVEQARRNAPWSVRGIDLSADLGLERGAAHVRGKLFDPEGDLVTWNVRWDDLPARRAVFVTKSALLTAPFRAELRVPARALEELPASIRPTDIEGNLALALDADGTLLDPRLRARATLERFTPASDRQRKRHLDLNLDAEYAAAGGRVALTALRRTEPVLELDSRWTGDARRLAGATGGKSPVLAELELALNDFPIGVVPALQQRHVRGRVSGKARLQGFGKDARVEMDLRTRELTVERLAVGELHALLRNVGGQLELQTEINGKAGQVMVRVSAPLVWGDQVIPTTDGQIGGTLRTRQLRLSALSPLVEGSISELDGKLDAEFDAKLSGGSTLITGRATLRDGVLQMPSVGQRFSDIDADVRVTPGAVRIEKLTARGLSGGFQASAEATLDGLTPTSAEASLSIKEDDKLPLTLEGESMGDIWGSVKASYRQSDNGRTNTLQVKLDKVHVELPETPSGDLQALAQPEYIRVGYRRRDEKFTPIPLQLLEEPSPPSEQTTLVLVDLGTVTIEKGQQAKVDLSGKIQATLGDELDVQGRIDTRRGELDISGKTFEIERGSVAFNGGKPDDPTIGAVARYDSPAGYAVYAEYTGTANKGKLALRAEPPLSQDEIVTLLMFGTPDGSLGAGSGDSWSTAVSVAGGTAAQGLNRAISDVTDLDVSARVDTSTGAPRPELVLQLTPRVAAKVSQALGEPTPGQSPDRTFVTVDLRLASHWSLSTMVGDRGASAFDLIWRKRY